MSLNKKYLWGAAFLLLCFFSITTCTCINEMRWIRKNMRSYHRIVEAVCTKSKESLTSLPAEFANVPFAEQLGVVVGVKKISLRGDVFPYNGSLIKRKPDGYHLFFRYDELNEASKPGFFSYIGCTELDAQFQQTNKDFVTVNTGTKSAEDPRILQIGKKHYVVYNDLTKNKNADARLMCMGELDWSNYKLKAISQFDPCLQSVEKNWVPFEYINNKGIADIYFGYAISPYKILKVDSLKEASLIHFSPPQAFKNIYWPSIWGGVRGGTIAQKVGNQYLAFFHSHFRDRHGIIWYCMGAYTFAAAPPFRLTAISHYPILFEGIYDSPPMNTSDPYKRVIFPAGFTVEERNDGDLIHVSCGENDSATKIITFNKDALLNSLKKIKSEPATPLAQLDLIDALDPDH